MHAKPPSSAQFKWNAIIYAYCLYFAVVFIGAVAHVQAGYLGALVLLLILYGRYGQYLLRSKIDGLFVCVILSMITPIVPVASYEDERILATFQELVKYYALDFVILIGVALPLTTLTDAKKKGLLFAAILIFLLLGCFWPGGERMEQGRVKGFLSNPNGFALTAMMLLCLFDPEKARFASKVTTHIIVLGLIYVSKTSGALIGYLAGLSYAFALGERRHISLGKVLVLSAICAALIALYIAMPPNTVAVVDKTKKKIDIAREDFEKVLAGSRIDFNKHLERDREDLTSGAWRIFQWRRILITLRESSIDKQMFGYGIGTSVIDLQKKPHNDYLRILYETGIIGFILNLSIWIIIYRRMDVRYRWLPVMVAVFCITENNYDHFPAMSLLLLYMLGANKECGAFPSNKTFTGYGMVSV